MADLVEVLIEEPRWLTVGLEALAERAATATLAELGIAPSGFLIALLGCDDARIAVLNADFRGRPQPTNVLSWPSEERSRPGGDPARPEPGSPDDPLELGDIALAWETCEREAMAAAKPVADHASHLIVHAVLHLVGYDHQSESEAIRMEAIEVGALARLGLPDPY